MGGILIVDDNANMRHLLRSFVETNTEFEVCGEAENGPDAIEKAKELHPDLILLDLTLPGMAGTEAVPILKRLLPQMKIICRCWSCMSKGLSPMLQNTLPDNIINFS